MATDFSTPHVVLPPAAVHIKSRGRVRDLGEVYTQPREVDAMLDLIPHAFTDIDTRFLEPAAGNGNFLVAFLERKIARINVSVHVSRSASSVVSLARRSIGP